MDPSLDAFINYDNDTTDFLNKDFPHFDFPLDSPSSNENNVFRNLPLNFPKTIQNVLDQDNNENKLSFMFNFDDVQPNMYQAPSNEKSQSTELYENYTTMEQTESNCSPNTAEENDSGLNNGSKKITKREKAKLKAKAKQETLKEMLESVDKKYIPAGFYDPNVDEESKKKMIQVIRNRVSAQSSRDKKKYYVQQLEGEKAELVQQNNHLINENAILNEQLMNKDLECRSLMEQIEALKRKEAAGCFKCGVTSDFGPSDTNDTIENTEDSASIGNVSDASSPLLYRSGGTRGRLFGFGVTFTTLMCMLLVMNTGNTAKQAASSKSLALKTFFNTSKVIEKYQKFAKVVQIEEPIKSKDIEFSLDEDYREFAAPVFDQIKPLVDRFENWHQEVLARFERSNVIVDLSNKKYDTIPSKITNPNSKNSSFLGKNATKNIQNATTTLIISNGFEVKKNESEMPLMTNTHFEEQMVGGDGMLQKGSHLDLEKAEYIQLFVPKSSVGQLKGFDGMQNPEFSNLPTMNEEGTTDSNSLLEVWCKIFAVRDVSAPIM